MTRMIPVHYRHLPIGCAYSFAQIRNRDLLESGGWTTLQPMRYRTDSELLRAQTEGIRIPEDTVVFTTEREMRRAELEPPKWLRRN